jgi:hypothetical protein
VLYQLLRRHQRKLDDGSKQSDRCEGGRTDCINQPTHSYFQPTSDYVTM